jgi:muramidase (phage lysozyme)
LVSVGVLSDRIETIMNRLTETDAGVDMQTAAVNVAAFLRVLQQCEGTANAGDPYRVCYGYTHTISDLSDHPAQTGEWSGVTLPDAMCANAGFGSGCKSTAAGAYQMIRGTWKNLKSDLGLIDFGPDSQDAAAIELIRRRGALEDVKAGRLEQAVYKVRAVWASLPGNYAKQGQRSIEQIAMWYQNEGGAVA